MRLVTLLALPVVFAVAAQAQPRTSAAPQHTLSIADEAVSTSLQAGGSDRNAVPGSGCSGYIDNARPSAKLTVEGDGPLAIYAVSGSDTTLLVSDPSGRWHCSDDANGSNPAVTFARAAPGTYVVWVGTFSPNEAPATLSAVRGQPAW
jgi:hypothetical protein